MNWDKSPLITPEMERGVEQHAINALFRLLLFLARYVFNSNPAARAQWKQAVALEHKNMADVSDEIEQDKFEINLPKEARH